MNARSKALLFVAAMAVVVAGVTANLQQSAVATNQAAEKENNDGFTDEFFLEDCEFTTKGANRYFILEPGYQLVFEGEDEGEQKLLVITVLDKTKFVDGVRTRVVEERETVDGELYEVSRNYFAICKETNSVMYFGEDVDFYEDGKIVGHDGTWHAGRNGAEAGLQMPGIVLLNAKYYQETAPKIALDRAQIISMEEEMRTPAGRFVDVLKTKETTPLEPDIVEFKYYAEGVGLISDGELQLKKYGFR